MAKAIFFVLLLNVVANADQPDAADLLAVESRYKVVATPEPYKPLQPAPSDHDHDVPDGSVETDKQDEADIIYPTTTYRPVSLYLPTAKSVTAGDKYLYEFLKKKKPDTIDEDEDGPRRKKRVRKIKKILKSEVQRRKDKEKLPIPLKSHNWNNWDLTKSRHHPSKPSAFENFRIRTDLDEAGDVEHDEDEDDTKAEDVRPDEIKSLVPLRAGTGKGLHPLALPDESSLFVHSDDRNVPIPFKSPRAVVQGPLLYQYPYFPAAAKSSTVLPQPQPTSSSLPLVSSSSSSPIVNDIYDLTPVYQPATKGPAYGLVYEPRPYSFTYGVKDDFSGTDFSREEESSGDVTKGSYQVALPDGRVQVVTYIADQDGFKATVSYKGHAVYPSPEEYSSPTYLHQEKVAAPAKAFKQPKPVSLAKVLQIPSFGTQTSAQPASESRTSLPTYPHFEPLFHEDTTPVPPTYTPTSATAIYLPSEPTQAPFLPTTTVRSLAPRPPGQSPAYSASTTFRPQYFGGARKRQISANLKDPEVAALKLEDDNFYLFFNEDAAESRSAPVAQIVVAEPDV